MLMWVASGQSGASLCRRRVFVLSHIRGSDQPRELCGEQGCPAGCHCSKVKTVETQGLFLSQVETSGSVSHLYVRLNGADIKTGDEKLVAPCPATVVLSEQDSSRYHSVPQFP